MVHENKAFEISTKTWRALDQLTLTLTLALTLALALSQSTSLVLGVCEAVVGFLWALRT
jgi:hypothetical protein